LYLKKSVVNCVRVCGVVRAKAALLLLLLLLLVR
jgi:hypothetical protein